MTEVEGPSELELLESVEGSRVIGGGSPASSGDGSSGAGAGSGPSGLTEAEEPGSDETDDDEIPEEATWAAVVANSEAAVVRVPWDSKEDERVD